MTPELQKELLEVLDRTNTHKNADKERVIPQEYLDYQARVDQQEISIDSPSSGVPVRCVITRPSEMAAAAPLFINLHGGGFVHPQDGDDDLFCARVAAEIGGVVIDVDYAVAPEYAFPVAFEQCWDVAEWAFAHAAELGVDPRRISIGGHSAGGTLTAAVCLRAAKIGSMRFALQVLDYAALDNAMALEPGGAERSRAFSLFYCDGNARVLKSPYCSPIFASDDMLQNQPRTLIVNAEHCPFRPVTERYGQRLAQAGNEVAFRMFPGSSHGFTIRLMGPWREAQDLIIRYLHNSVVQEVK